MRKITREICSAFEAGHKKTISNSHTDGMSLWLHGNKIAEKRSDGIYISDGGYPLSMTTKERLKYFASVYTKNYVDYVNGVEWDGNWIKVK